MTFSPGYKAIVQGVLVYVVGYAACAMATTARANLIGRPYPRWTWAMLSVVLLLVPLLAGARGAHVAVSRKHVHGAIAGFLGAAATLLVLVPVMGAPIPAVAMTGGLILSTLLAWLGAILLPILGSRRGL